MRPLPSKAPTVFVRDEAGSRSYVLRQPESPEEIALAREAREDCPTESIGEDG